MAYDVLVALHVVAALVGFGAIALTGAYAVSARRIERPGAMEEAVRYFGVRSVAEWAVVAVPFLGVAAVLVQPHGRGLGHPWIVIALILWASALGVVAGVGRPARAALRSALPAGPVGSDAAGRADAAAVVAAAGRLALAAAVCDVIFVLAAVDMVLKP